MQQNIIQELNVHNHPFNFSFASLATSRSIWRRAELPAPLLSSPAPVTLPQPDLPSFTEPLSALLTFAFSCSNSVLKCSRLHLEIVVWSGTSITRMLMVETFYFWFEYLFRVSTSLHRHCGVWAVNVDCHADERLPIQHQLVQVTPGHLPEKIKYKIIMWWHDATDLKLKSPTMEARCLIVSASWCPTSAPALANCWAWLLL